MIFEKKRPSIRNIIGTFNLKDKIEQKIQKKEGKVNSSEIIRTRKKIITYGSYSTRVEWIRFNYFYFSVPLYLINPGPLRTGSLSWFVQHDFLLFVDRNFNSVVDRSASESRGKICKNITKKRPLIFYVHIRSPIKYPPLICKHFLFIIRFPQTQTLKST